MADLATISTLLRNSQYMTPPPPQPPPAGAEAPFPPMMALPGLPPQPTIARLLREGIPPAPLDVPTLTGRENQPQPVPADQDLPIDKIQRRQQVIDTMGVDPHAPDFQEQLWRKFARDAAPQIIGQAAFGLGRAAPRLTAGAIGMLAPSATGNAEAQQGGGSPEVQQLQTRLRDAGFYRGPIDGRMGPA